MINPAEALKNLNQSLKENNIECILVGGFAVNAYQFSRATNDIDFIIKSEDIKKIRTLMSSAGYTTDGVENLFSRFRHNQLPLEAIDFLLVDSNTFNELKINAQTTVLFGQQFFIPSLLHLIALKLHALKQGQAHRFHKDMLDILELIRINNVNYRENSFRDLCLKYGSQEIYEKLTSLLK